MKAKVVEGFYPNNPEKRSWMILIQKNNGDKYNNGLMVDGKPYFTYHRIEAITKVRRLNDKFKTSCKKY